MSEKDEKQLLWSDIKQYSGILFGVWAGIEQYLWAEEAWGAIVKAGLANYRNSEEKQIVLLRLMCLATMYHEFCELAFDLSFQRNDETSEWLAHGVINPLRLWEFPKPKWLEQVIFNNPDDLEGLACLLIDEHRDEIYKALVRGFDDLFVSMLMTAYEDNESIRWADNDGEKFYDTLSDVEERAFYWISIGMPRNPGENV